MLEITNLHTTVAGKPILNGLTLSVPIGEVHDQAKDRLRDDVLAQFGFLVLRVSNSDVMANAEGVIEAIRLAASGRSSRHSPHPNPSPEGEGLEAVEAQKLLGISWEGSVG